MPSTTTVHAPHAPCSQPRCVAVRRQRSRRKSASVSRGSTSWVTLSPFNSSVSDFICFASPARPAARSMCASALDRHRLAARATPTSSAIAARRRVFRDLLRHSSFSATVGSRCGRAAAAASTTDTGPPLPCETAKAIEFANAPLFRTTLKTPQRSGAAGRGTSKPTMISSVRATSNTVPERSSSTGSDRVPFRPEICDHGVKRHQASRPVGRGIGQRHAAANRSVVANRSI